MVPVQNKFEHLEWALRSRAKNQSCSLKLLGLFDKHPDTWKTKNFSRAAQDLIAVSFSLWRSAFLAHKTGRRAVVFEHGRDFLEKIIEDNMISYPQDKNAREWTFNYYTRSARSSLQQLAKFWDGIAPAYEGKKRSPTERWDYCQELLDKAVMNFEELLAKRETSFDNAQKVKAARQEKRQRRKKVRQMTLSSRRNAGG